MENNNNVKLPKKVAVFLEKNNTKFETIGHRTVFTAFDKAATMKVKPTAIAKVLVLKIDKDIAMAIVGGDRNLDLEGLQKLAKAKKIDFAKERAIVEICKGIDPGAIPPFGDLWGVKVFCDKKILEVPRIIFSGGSYEVSVKMAPGTFKKMNSGMLVGNFSKKKEKKPRVIKKIKPKAMTKKIVAKKKK
jgi:Ala-tRNA(Pro) deacylase